MKIKLKKHVVAVVMATALAAASMVHAETTMILELQEKLTQQSELYAEGIDRLGTLQKPQEKANDWYVKAKELPNGSQDHKYAIARYVSERLKVVEPQMVTVKDLRTLNNAMTNTVEQLADVVAKEQASRQLASLNDLPPESFNSVMTQLQGSHALMQVMSNDPVISSAPEFGNVRQAYELAVSGLLDNSGTTSVDMASRLRQLGDVIEAQGVLLDIAWQRLNKDNHWLQTIDTSAVTNAVAINIQGVLDRLFGAFNSLGVAVVRPRDIDILNESMKGAKPHKASASRLNDIGQRLEEVRKQRAAM